jgi:hypothetical protein
VRNPDQYVSEPNNYVARFLCLIRLHYLSRHIEQMVQMHLQNVLSSMCLDTFNGLTGFHGLENIGELERK